MQMFKFKNPFKHEQTDEEKILEGMVWSRAMLESCNGFDPNNSLCVQDNGCMKCPMTAGVVKAYRKGVV